MWDTHVECEFDRILFSYFQTNPCQHPIVILRDVSEEDMRSLLKFMYHGEVSIAEERLKDFLRTAETLQVRGLVDEETAAQMEEASGAEAAEQQIKATFVRCPFSVL